MISKFEEALVNCSREPIHIPGAIQPFGVLLALDDELRLSRGWSLISFREERSWRLRQPASVAAAL